jgi:3-hydroxyisobutyrate dehydrogenase-like beta-hydroxyacid dehydrogenase
MSGGATGADAGTLTLMLGGDKAAFDRTEELLKPIGYIPASGTPSYVRKP